MGFSSHAKGINWEKTLSNLVRRMPQELDTILANLLAGSEDGAMSEVAVTFKARVIFMELKGRRVLRSTKYGAGDE